MRSAALTSDAGHILRAVELARRAEGFTHPNPMVGCVLVRDGGVVSEGWHKGPGQDHAEAMALRLAAEKARGTTAYVTLEPCNHYGRTPPCSKALIEAGVAEVVYGLRDVNPEAEGGAAALRAAGIEARLTESREARSACAELVRPWVHSLRCHRPWVTAKVAMSLDGFTATEAGESKWITGKEARARGHDLRQRTGAIMVGSGTMLADDPSLDARPEGRKAAPSLKVVLDSQLRTPTDAKLLKSFGPALIIGHEGADPARADVLREAGAEVELLPGENNCPDLLAALRLLKKRDITDLMIEGGGTLLGAAFTAGIVDEVWAFIAPVILGGGRNAASGAPFQRLRDAYRLQCLTAEPVGQDILLRGLRQRKVP
ncbi:bifunctional diaminohydroxyphosphoribosylaminopyrimidine deaminase/5-amino-6-(5-phosphoribosylamino)uracil reductase RibD [Parvularcula maris]|uniref:Riboflavin biosynthesis protein RibD n=1 Tax=Parvularcula maris TaxID=2965077 RepID=A0A9X2L7W4_9PROT|nr:bifunctional diaminohydroxyphosphoribosylaminopyrimidine deaminase/5-amino-6-(5-phosphoribosylamino)uracil reductase RibD [Parvularcula maris]MCQ8184748.1 bifunctional diaminohydroxyphosphoribosylaminopyrimidine deaminase/5-amino-6-(5-phosphoribosylamino)uracil reductase RibD [Parvularcula maris]